MAMAMIRFQSVTLVALGALAACAQPNKVAPPVSAKVETSRDAIARPIPDATATLIDPAQPSGQCVAATAPLLAGEAIMAPYAERLASLTCQCSTRELQRRFTVAEFQQIAARTNPVLQARLLGIIGVCIDQAQRTVFPS